MAATSIFITYTALFLFLFHLSKHFLRSRIKQKLPPCPPSLPIIGHLHHLKTPLHQFLSKLSTQFGPIFLLRFGILPAVVITSAAVAEECFTTNDISLANRPRKPSFRANSYNYTNLALANHGPGWLDMRRVAMTQALSGHRLAFFADVRAAESRDLARRLYKNSVKENFVKIEIRSQLFGLAMNVMTRMMIGKRYYEEGDDNEIALRFRKTIEESFSILGESNAGDFLPSIIGWILRRSVEKRLAQIHCYRDKFLQSIVEERRKDRLKEEDDEGRTMLDAILSMQNNHPKQYDDTFIKALFVTLLGAGTDTSSSTMEWAMSLLLNNPMKLELARKEIDEKVGFNRLFDESDLANTPYLHCIINETLRLYPVVPLLLPHLSTKHCKIGDYDVSSGTMLMVNAYAIHRDPAIWPMPTEFIPERYHYIDYNVQGRKIFLPFGMGRRRCPGEAMAMKEVGLVLGTLIQCFDWKRIGPKDVDMKEGSGITMPRVNPLEALFRPREMMANVLSHL